MKGAVQFCPSGIYNFLDSWHDQAETVAECLEAAAMTLGQLADGKFA